MLALLSWLVVASTTPTARAADFSAEFVAVDDTTTNRELPDDSFGDDNTLRVDGLPTSEALLRFELNGIPSDAQITSATLSLHVNEPTGVAIGVYGVNGDWTEQTAWANAPERGELITRLPAPARAGDRVEADVTAALDSDGVLDLYLATSEPNGSDLRIIGIVQPADANDDLGRSLWYCCGRSGRFAEHRPGPTAG